MAPRPELLGTMLALGCLALGCAGTPAVSAGPDSPPIPAPIVPQALEEDGSAEALDSSENDPDRPTDLDPTLHAS